MQLNKSKYVGVKAAAQLLGVSTHTIYQYTHQRLIPFYKFNNGKLKFKEDELLHMIEKFKVEPSGQGGIQNG